MLFTIIDKSGIISTININSSNNNNTAIKRNFDKLIRNIKKANEKLIIKLMDVIENKLDALYY